MATLPEDLAVLAADAGRVGGIADAAAGIPADENALGNEGIALAVHQAALSHQELGLGCLGRNRGRLKDGLGGRNRLGGGRHRLDKGIRGGSSAALFYYERDYHRCCGQQYHHAGDKEHGAQGERGLQVIGDSQGVQLFDCIVDGCSIEITGVSLAVGGEEGIDAHHGAVGCNHGAAGVAVVGLDIGLNHLDMVGAVGGVPGDDAVGDSDVAGGSQKLSFADHLPDVNAVFNL